MKSDLGRVDGLLRVAAGLMLIAGFFLLAGDVRWLGLLGVIPLITGAFNRWPAYAAFGFDTCHARRN